ncbi:MAG: hypothetical protein IID13_11110, partial [Candidatus Marinimicrobia bacterium]|nr:hypothetical protein [Candidatus Neomarinimicrobiota bacterium]
FRIQCYVLGEFGSSMGVQPLARSRFLQAGVVMSTGLLVTLLNQEQVLWPLFGTTNQLVGALALLVITVWVMSKGRRYWFTLAPMLFVAGMTSWALTKEIGFYYRSGNWLLLAIALIILSFEGWILVEGWQVFRRLRAKRNMAR